MVEHSATTWIIVTIVTVVLLAAVTRILRRWDYVRRRFARSWVGQVQSGILMAVFVVTALFCVLLLVPFSIHGGGTNSAGPRLAAHAP